MKREKILFFLEKDKIYLYFVKSDREKVVDLDTSLFFKFGEISDVARCEDAITEILSKTNFGPYYLKPDVVVLYNGVSYSDAKFLYKYVLRGLNYNQISFISFKDVVKKLKNVKNVVVFNKDYYVLIDRGEKIVHEDLIDFEPIMVGKPKSKHLHYSEENIMWKTFRTYFTNVKSYDMMDVGDDEL